MEKALGSRCADQCRSHHQKVEIEAKSQEVDTIIEFLSKRLHQKEEIKKKFEEKLHEEDHE